ncbi:MAG: CoA ester lyase [Dermatophilus congolensis]|nr:CoA ester lyase [Dermatophilus congolensis]
MIPVTEYRPRRSVLYMPSSNARALEKATTLPCDGIIFDLEDAVAPDAKVEARAAACAAVQSGRYGRRELVIRVNAADTPWHSDDLAAAAAAAPDAILVPKVNSADEVLALVSAMEAAGAPEKTKLWAMIETPAAILGIASLAAASPRLEVFVMGSNDLVKELRAEHVPGRAPILTAMSLAVLGVRAAGKVILDAVYNDVRDLEGFREEAVQARQFGFDGKSLVHPGQVGPANEVFAPDPDALEDARGVIEAWEAGAGSGVVTYKGRMVEGLHVEIARDTLAMHEAIVALG